MRLEDSDKEQRRQPQSHQPIQAAVDRLNPIDLPMEVPFGKSLVAADLAEQFGTEEDGGDGVQAPVQVLRPGPVLRR